VFEHSENPPFTGAGKSRLRKCVCGVEQILK
jgi:hypothetical protein